MFQPTLVNGHVNREDRFSRRGRSSRALVEGLLGHFSLAVALLTLVTPFQSPRFARVKRPYTAADVVSKRGTLPISYPADIVARKVFALFSEHFKRRTPSHTYGAYALPRLALIL